MGYISRVSQKTLNKFRRIMNEIEILSMAMEDAKVPLSKILSYDDIDTLIQYLTNTKEAIEDTIETLHKIRELKFER